jgi:PilZ domain
LEAENQPALRPSPELADARREPRYKLAVDITIKTKTCGVLEGHTVDISGSGISALLRLEVPLGEFVELQFVLPFGPVAIYATVRQRNAFRYGFQFVESHALREIIHATCKSLKLEQSLFGEK